MKEELSPGIANRFAHLRLPFVHKNQPGEKLSSNENECKFKSRWCRIRWAAGIKGTTKRLD